MQNSQPSNQTVAKLLEADADLAAQEVELNAQIQSIGEKRYSLKTVIDMFAPAHTTTTLPVATPAPIPVAKEQLQLTTPDTVVPELDVANVDTTEASASVAPTPQKQKAKKNSSPTSSKQNNQSASTKKQSKAPDTWQQYVKDEFSNVSLAEAVSEVMQQHSEQVLEIGIIDLFKNKKIWQVNLHPAFIGWILDILNP